MSRQNYKIIKDMLKVYENGFFLKYQSVKKKQQPKKPVKNRITKLSARFKTYVLSRKCNFNIVLLFIISNHRIQQYFLASEECTLLCFGGGKNY